MLTSGHSIARRQADVDVAVADLDGVDGNGFGGGQPGRLAGAQVEARAVQPALQGAAVDLALGERRPLRASTRRRRRRSRVVLAVHERDRGAVDLDR